MIKVYEFLIKGNNFRNYRAVKIDNHKTSYSPFNFPNEVRWSNDPTGCNIDTDVFKLLVEYQDLEEFNNKFKIDFADKFI